jgi:hypothetical protein
MSGSGASAEFSHTVSLCVSGFRIAAIARGKTRVNALMAASGMTVKGFSAAC